MALNKLSQITEVGIQSGITLRDINVEGANVSGAVTATTLSVSEGFNVAGVVTATSFNGNVTGNINPSTLLVAGVSTFQASSFWGDGDIAYFGDGQDLLIFHNSTDSIIRDNGTGDLYIEGGNRIRMTNPTGIETYATFNQDGAVELYYDNSKKLETTGVGVTVSGILQTQGLQSSGIVTATNGVQVGSASSITVGQSFIRNNQVGLGATTTTGRDAGIGTALGTLIYNVTTQSLEFFNGTNWTSVTSFSATGGTETTVGSTRVHTFTGTGPFTVITGQKTNTSILIIGAGGAGGGRGGNDGSGGGGAGALYYSTSLTLNPGSYTVTIGGGGAGVGPAAQGNSGNSSSFNFSLPLSAAGGGGGGAEGPTAFRDGAPGGCGGGAGGYGEIYVGGTGSGATGGSNGTVSPAAGWGNPGGRNLTTPERSASPNTHNNGGGGGGGAGSAGMSGKQPVTLPTQYDMTPLSGNGGNGLAYTISGSSVYYAGGGGCGGNSHPATNDNPGAYGGLGGGGNGGGGPLGAATSGTSNRGGGGGGAQGTNSPAPDHNSGSGGSGIVIIAYPL
jgi:hypothetical protein